MQSSCERNKKQQGIQLSAHPFTTDHPKDPLGRSAVSIHCGKPTALRRAHIFPQHLPTLPHCTAPARLIPSLFLQACPASCSPGCILQGHIPPSPLRDERHAEDAQQLVVWQGNRSVLCPDEGGESLTQHGLSAKAVTVLLCTGKCRLL